MEAAALIRDWSQRGQGFFGTLKQALAGGRFSDAFDRLRGELAERLTDMQLYLAVRVAVDTAGWAREDESADRADRDALPAVIAGEADDGARTPPASPDSGGTHRRATHDSLISPRTSAAARRAQTARWRRCC